MLSVRGRRGGRRSARADDQAEARKLIDKAIKVQGITEALAKHAAVTIKMKGRFYGMGDGIDYTGSIASQQPDRYRFEISMTIGNQAITILQVVKGDQGWMSLAGMTQELSKEQVAEVRESMHVQRVARLACLSGKDYKLSTLGELKVDKRPALGVRVEFKGRRDVNLFFDKESGLLVKTETRARDVFNVDQEFTAETYQREYKKVGDAMIAHKHELRRDDKLYVESEIIEFTPAEKLDDGLFNKP